MKAVYLVLFVALGTVQYRLWVGDGSLAEVWRLEQAIEAQRTENAGLKARNVELIEEVQDLKQGLAAIEARARRELGMVGEGEVYFHLVD